MLTTLHRGTADQGAAPFQSAVAIPHFSHHACRGAWWAGRRVSQGRLAGHVPCWAQPPTEGTRAQGRDPHGVLHRSTAHRGGAGHPRQPATPRCHGPVWQVRRQVRSRDAHHRPHGAGGSLCRGPGRPILCGAPGNDRDVRLPVCMRVCVALPEPKPGRLAALAAAAMCRACASGHAP